jgi:uncharacterized protein YndB with AHSA1/START domain
MKTYLRARQSKASPERVWSIWSDVSTRKDWNPNVASMTIAGAFQSGTHLVMHTREGRTHDMLMKEVQPGRSFHLETRVVPGTRFTFVCEIKPEAGGSAISQGLQVGGPLGALFGRLAGDRIASTFSGLLDGLARIAEEK